MSRWQGLSVVLLGSYVRTMGQSCIAGDLPPTSPMRRHKPRPCSAARCCVVALLVTAAGGGCSSGRTSTPTLEGSRPSGDVVSTPSNAGGSGISERAAVACADAVGSSSPSTDYEVVDRAVALPTSSSSRTAPQTGLTGVVASGVTPLRLYAKVGIYVHSDTEVELMVPVEARTQLAIGAGNPPRSAYRLLVAPCPASGEWLNFVGGVWAAKVGCFPLEVHTGRTVSRVDIGIGAPCPGQQPPLGPSEA